MKGFVAIACFFLAFIPELGTIISVVLPLPLIILAPPKDHRQIDPDFPFADWRALLLQLLEVVCGMMLIKLLVGNILSSLIMGKNRVLSGALKEENAAQEIKETHPVIILFGVVIAGEIWGVTGMVISVPMISFIRLAFNVFYSQMNSDGAIGFHEQACTQ